MSWNDFYRFFRNEIRDPAIETAVAYADTQSLGFFSRIVPIRKNQPAQARTASAFTPLTGSTVAILVAVLYLASNMWRTTANYIGYRSVKSFKPKRRRRRKRK